MRFHKSGELVFFYGAPDNPEEAKRGRKNEGPWLLLIVLTMGLLLVGPQVLGLPAVGHALKTFLAAIW